MAFAQRRNRQTTHFSERILVVKRRVTILDVGAWSASCNGPFTPLKKKKCPPVLNPLGGPQSHCDTAQRALAVFRRSGETAAAAKNRQCALGLSDAKSLAPSRESKHNSPVVHRIPTVCNMPSRFLIHVNTRIYANDWRIAMSHTPLIKRIPTEKR